ncbi:hypothetical protein BvCmsHHP012_04178 [Escherichia coli]|nr:hypothetical protein BvCmsHHP012_04178 [Escherichia coli]
MRGDRRGIRETRGHRVFPGQKAIPASVGQRVSVVRQAHRGYRGHGVKPDPWDRKERRVFRGLLVLRAREVKPEPEAKKESREIPEDLRDQKVTLAPEGSRGLRGRLVHRALPAPEDHKGKKGVKVTPARQVLPVSGGRKVSEVQRAPWGRRGRRGQRAIKAREERRGLRVRQGSLPAWMILPTRRRLFVSLGWQELTGVISKQEKGSGRQKSSSTG